MADPREMEALAFEQARLAGELDRRGDPSRNPCEHLEAALDKVGETVRVLRAALSAIHGIVYDHLDYDTQVLHQIARVIDTQAVREARGIVVR